jgi:hypothetical protein
MKPDHVPFNFNARRLSVFGKNQLREILDNLLREGVIPESNSPYASPIVLVKKKTGGLRLCIDFLTLNKQVVKDRYPLPFIDNQINKLRGIFYQVRFKKMPFITSSFLQTRRSTLPL